MRLLVGPTFAEHWGDGHMGSGWMWLWGALVALLLVAAVVALVALAARVSHADVAQSDAGARRARDIVMERYARGEISASEYDELSARLR